MNLSLSTEIINRDFECWPDIDIDVDVQEKQIRDVADQRRGLDRVRSVSILGK